MHRRLWEISAVKHLGEDAFKGFVQHDQLRWSTAHINAHDGDWLPSLRMERANLFLQCDNAGQFYLLFLECRQVALACGSRIFGLIKRETEF